ncbi:DUF3006 family protein [Oceanobacillus saliphilus]|uniref:DUF3006 family protein n=1 Tax=Oceanobacillus saliphilus TaxID=2925834 RepID=UPI00201E1657|nr:DUF3006 family protein [Oceanobacillus saliphilus]
MNSNHSVYILSVIAGILALLVFTSFVFSKDDGSNVKIVGLIDRFENDFAVILLEELEEEIILPKTLLPPHSQDDTYLTIELVPVTPRIMSNSVR